MGLSAGIALTAIGAVLAFAVHATVSGLISASWDGFS